MRKLTNEELQTILEKHKKWLNREEGGERANLHRADLCKANLAGANLAGADLTMANLTGANLAMADLTGADLNLANLAGANLCKANLCRTDLYRANLYRADLYRADLCEANLHGADLREATLCEANLCGADLAHTDLYESYVCGLSIDKDTMNRYFPLVCPCEGSFIGWKKVRNNMIVKLLIPKDAKRSSAFGRKCRCDKAVVLSIESIDGTPDEDNYIVSSIADPNFMYKIGETVSVSNFCEDRTRECAPGIHFFITREEAVEYGV